MTRERLLEWRQLWLEEWRNSGVKELQNAAMEKVGLCDLALKGLLQPEAARTPGMEVAGFFKQTDGGWVEIDDREASDLALAGDESVCLLYREGKA